MVIRDCGKQTIERFSSGKRDGLFDISVFCCPDNDTNNGWNQYITEVKTWLHNITQPIDYSDKRDIKWWKKIDKFGLVLPLSIVNLYTNQKSLDGKKKKEVK